MLQYPAQTLTTQMQDPVRCHFVNTLGCLLDLTVAFRWAPFARFSLRSKINEQAKHQNHYGAVGIRRSEAVITTFTSITFVVIYHQLDTASRGLRPQ